MFKRVRWVGLGAAAGAAGTVWTQRAVRRQLDGVTRGDVAGAVRQAASRSARSAGRQAVVGLRAAATGALPRRGARRAGRVDDEIDLRPSASGSGSNPGGPYRPANWRPPGRPDR